MQAIDLMKAAEGGDIADVQAAIDGLRNLNMRGQNNNTPLHIAALRASVGYLCGCTTDGAFLTFGLRSGEWPR